MTKTAIRAVPNYYPGAADLADGYMLSTEFSSIGGAEYETRTEIRAGVQIQTKVTKVDHAEIQKKATSIINKAYIVMQKNCAPAFGAMHFVPEGEFQALDAALQPLRDEAALLNELCEARRSTRETRVEIFPFRVDVRNHRVALRVGLTLFSRLSALRDAYTADTRHKFTAEWRQSQNLEKLVSGYHYDLVREAMLATRAQRDQMVNYMATQRAGNSNRERGMFDYGPIDKAIAQFAPAAKAFT